MHFSYFCNQNNRNLVKPFGAVLRETRDIAQYCDHHDWHSIWFTEHHFGHEGFEVCPNPLMAGADIVARTKRIRIGQAANIITFRHPITLAEDIAMLDHMSNGRIEVGVGRGIYGR
ncbi:MAG: LLM class flavin-dependent oxidoreductase, partial [Pseudomonadota bacterium]